MYKETAIDWFSDIFDFFDMSIEEVRRRPFTDGSSIPHLGYHIS